MLTTWAGWTRPRGDRLVAQHEFGLHHQRAGDADALALAAGEFVGVLFQRALVHAHLAQHLNDAPAPVGSVQLFPEVQRFPDQFLHVHERVEGRIGVWKMICIRCR
jgi:hypothetical protein